MVFPLFYKSLKLFPLGLALWVLLFASACTSTAGGGLGGFSSMNGGADPVISNAAVPGSPSTVAAPNADPTKKMPYVFLRKWGVLPLPNLDPEKPMMIIHTITGNLALTSDPFQGLGNGKVLRVVNHFDKTYFDFQLETIGGVEGSFVLKVTAEANPYFSFYLTEPGYTLDPVLNYAQQDCPSQGSCAPLNGKKLVVPGMEEPVMHKIQVGHTQDTVLTDQIQYASWGDE